MATPRPQAQSTASASFHEPARGTAGAASSLAGTSITTAAAAGSSVAAGDLGAGVLGGGISGSPPLQCQAKLVAQDRLFGALGAVLWAVTAFKLAPHIACAHNLQTAVGLAAIVGVSLLWPAVHPASYRRWRVPALAGVRLGLACLPVNFETAVYDTLAPRLATGRLSWLMNVSHIMNGTHLTLLVFAGVGWRLPLRVHMPLQALKVAVLARFGTQAHLRSQLLCSPEVEAAVQAVHSAMAIAAEVLMPAASLGTLLRLDLESQKAALLLFWWAVVGWLLPTLMLIWPQMPTRHAALGEQVPAGPVRHRRSSRTHGSRSAVGGACHLSRLLQAAGWAADQLEAGLCSLLRSQPAQRWQGQQQQRQQGEQQEEEQQEQQQEQQQQQAGGILPLLLRWLGVLLGVWLVCCAVAPRSTTGAAS